MAQSKKYNERLLRSREQVVVVLIMLYTFIMEIPFYRAAFIFFSLNLCKL